MNITVLLDRPEEPTLSNASVGGPRVGPGGPRTLADLIHMIQGHPDLPDRRRRFLASHIRTCARIAGRAMGIDKASPAAIPCDLPKLNAILFEATPAAHKLSKESFINVTGGLRLALRLAGLIQPETAGTAPEGTRWRALTDAIPDTFCRIGLGRFAAWCHQNGIAPEAVSDETLAEFGRWARTRQLHGDIAAYMRGIAKSWRKVSRMMEAWPSSTLNAPERRQHYTLPMTAFPLSFQEDVRRLTNRLARTDGRGPFRSEGPARPLRPSTIETRLYNLRQAASALVILGRNPATITSLAALVEERAFEEILTFFWRRKIDARIAQGELSPEAEPPPEAGVTSQTAAIGSALMLVARYHVGLPPEALSSLAGLAADVRPARQYTLTQKNRDRLNLLAVPKNRAKLLALPRTLMALAEQLRTTRPKKAHQLAMAAVAIEFELNIPLRITNLTELRLGQHLKRLDPRSGRISLLSLQEWEVKNEVVIERPIDPELGAFLDRYIKDFRGIDASPENQWLFPAANGDDAPRSIDGMRYAITEAIAEHVGVRVNVHLFRAFVATLILEDDPGALEDVRVLLGHKTLQTALAYYAYLNPTLAAKRFTAVLKRARSKAPPVSKPKRRGAGR